MLMQYPLEEKIGPPELLVGRAEEFARFNKWLAKIPQKLSKSRVILARRKSGKTSFVQRLFNQLWSQNGQVIPFYYEFAEAPIGYLNFAIAYYETFASHYISFRERDPQMVRNPLSLEKILDYGQTHNLTALADDAAFILNNKAHDRHTDLIWRTVCSAPHRYASLYDIRFLVILDEFQYIEQFIYFDTQANATPIKGMAGSYHALSESKVAPMLVTGSYIGLLQKIMDDYLEAGRLSISRFEPYLTPEEGLLAVYRYAELYQEPITNQTAQQINELCLYDPFFISCVILSEFAEKDLTTTEGVINTVNFEISDRESGMSKTWAEYLMLTFRRVNGIHTKQLIFYLNKHGDRYWTPRELKSKLGLDLSEEEIYQKLVLLAESDVIDRGVSDIQFRGLQDGTLNLIIRHRFEEQIAGFEPNFKDEFKQKLEKLTTDKERLQGRNNYLEGLVAEHLLAIEFRTRKRFRPSAYFTGVKDDRLLTVVEVLERAPFQRRDGKSEEIDLLARSDDGCILMVEVRKHQEKTNRQAVQDLRDNAAAYSQQFGVTVIPAFLSLAGFTKEAQTFCQEQGIGSAEQIAYAYRQEVA